MPHQAILGALGVFYHLMIRGMEGKRIFPDIQDRKDFVTPLGDLAKQTATLVLAGEPGSWVLVREYGISAAEIARQLGVCTSTIARAL